MNFKVDSVILKLVSAEMVPTQNYNKETKKWIPTGGEEKVFEYIFVTNDEFQEKIVLRSKQDYSKFEGREVNVIMDWKYDNFNKKMGLARLADVIPV